MPIDFPTSPVTNQQYTYAGKTYVFSAQGTWVPTGGGAFTASATSPASPTPGDRWYDLSTGILAIYVNDGTSSQWVMVSPSGGVTGVSAPQGRLTLATGVPVMTTTQSAKTTIFYTPYVGNQVPIYDGTKMVMTTFAELSVATTDTTKNPAAVGASQILDWFIWSDAGTLRISHGPAWTSDTVRSAGTALVMVAGVLLNNASITNACAAQRGTYVGTTRSNASSQLDWIYGAAAANGTAGFFGVWNCYNRVSVSSISSDTTDSWAYTIATWRPANNSPTMRASYVSGLAENSFSGIYNAVVTGSAGQNAVAGVGYDSTSAFTGLTGVLAMINIGTPQAILKTTSLGFHFMQAIEYSTAAGVTTWYGDNGGYMQSGLVFEGMM